MPFVTLTREFEGRTRHTVPHGLGNRRVTFSRTDLDRPYVVQATIHHEPAPHRPHGTAETKEISLTLLDYNNPDVQEAGAEIKMLLDKRQQPATIIPKAQRRASTHLTL